MSELPPSENKPLPFDGGVRTSICNSPLKSIIKYPEGKNNIKTQSGLAYLRQIYPNVLRINTIAVMVSGESTVATRTVPEARAASFFMFLAMM